MPTIKTSDFVTVSTLVLRKHRLLRTIKDNPKRVVFEFEKTQELEADIESLRRGELLVDPYDYWHAQKRIKQRIYDGI